MIRTILIGLVVGAAFLMLALWGVPMAELGTVLAQAHWIYLVPVTLAFVAQQALRAWRQAILVRTLAPAATYRSQLSIFFVGFVCINTFPARLGEAVRPYLYWRRENVGLGASFGLVVVERLIDIVALFVVILGIVLWVEVPDRTIAMFGRELSLVELSRSAALVVLPPALVLLLGLVVFGQAALRLGARLVEAFEHRIGSGWLLRFSRGVLRFAESFVAGVASLRDPRRLAAIVVLTVLIFFTMGLAAMWLAYAFELESFIGFGESLTVVIVTMLAIALPAPPGFAGVFEAGARAGLALFGVYGGELDARALAYALAMHWWTYLLFAVGAGYFLWRDRLDLGQLFRFARESAQTESPVREPS